MTSRYQRSRSIGLRQATIIRVDVGDSVTNFDRKNCQLALLE